MECSEPSGSDVVLTRRAGNFSNPCCAGGGTKGSLSTLAASGWRYRQKGCAAISLSKSLRLKNARDVPLSESASSSTVSQ